MAIPLKYNLRNLFVRKVSTLMTIFVVCLVVTVFLFVLALWQGVSRTLSVTASTRNIITMRVGSQAEMQSVITKDASETIRSLSGIEKSPSGEPYVSAELISLVNLPRADGQTTNVQVRGMDPIGFAMRPGVRIVDGRTFRLGTNEAVVSKNLANRFAGMKIGDTIKTGSYRWVVVGHFDASGSAYESEIWTDAKDLQGQTKRQIFSSRSLASERPGRGLALHRDGQGGSEAEARGEDREKILRGADGHRRSDQDPGDPGRHLHGDRRRLRGHEHDVCPGGREDARDRYASGDRVLPTGGPGLLHPRGALAVSHRRRDRNGRGFRPFQPVADEADRHDELPHVFRGPLQLPPDAPAHDRWPRLLSRDGSPRRVLPCRPRRETQDHQRPA